MPRGACVMLLPLPLRPSLVAHSPLDVLFVCSSRAVWLTSFPVSFCCAEAMQDFNAGFRQRKNDAKVPPYHRHSSYPSLVRCRAIAEPVRAPFCVLPA